MADLRRYCEILGNGHNAGPDEIRQAYRELVKTWHPDRFSRDSRLQEKGSGTAQEHKLGIPNIHCK
jgi:molecular chaperone DnaJ